MEFHNSWCPDEVTAMPDKSFDPLIAYLWHICDIQIVNLNKFAVCICVYSEAGKVSQIAYNEFIGLARRLIVTVYKARDPTPVSCNHTVGTSTKINKSLPLCSKISKLKPNFFDDTKGKIGLQFIFFFF